ncbi:MAG: EXLDI protein, partial [Bacillota bacterium]|nr:EXLDI protein [Bacillota bacterium]
GFEEITVTVGQAGSRRRKRFLGRRLARWRHPHSRRGRVETFTVYRTRRGRYALHRSVGPDWSLWSDPQWWRDPENWNFPEWWKSGDATLEVFDSLDDLASRVPPELMDVIRGASEEPPLEDLDI